MVAVAGAGTGGATPGGLATTDEAHGGGSAPTFAQALVGGSSSGVTINGATYTGSPRAVGTFHNGTAAVGMADGIVLGTGHIQTVPGDRLTPGPCTKGVEGPNQCHETNAQTDTAAASSDNGTAGDQSLTTLAGQATHDAAVLTISFTPRYPTIQFRYVFGSEEYNDWNNLQFNDVFGFFVNGRNCALVPGTTQPVSVNTINNGNPFQDPTPHNPQYFIDNVRPAPSRDTELDGLTTVLTCTADVRPGEVNTMKLAIADASDSILDSAVFIEAGSLISGTQMTTMLHGNGQDSPQISVPAGEPAYDSAKLAGANASAATGTVSYAVYSDATCSTLVQSAGTKTVVNGVIPDSDPVTLSTPGTYYWQASYGGDLGNNPVANDCGDEVETVTVPARTVSVADASTTEGGALVFTVSLDAPAVVPVTVDWSTSDGIATTPADYAAASGTATIATGDSSTTVTVATTQDTLDEPDESLAVSLSNPSNAAIGDGNATGTIVDDDPTPTVSISDETYLENDSGTVTGLFTISLSAASGRDVTVGYATADGTAVAGSDYVATSGTATIPAGSTSVTVPVQVIGDTAFEPTETFTVNLSSPTNATIAKGAGVGTIHDNDNRPPTCGAASVTPDTLWSPNGKFVTVTVGGCTDADHDTLTYSIVKVEQDEARGGDVDAKRVAGHPNQVQLRAERLGTGNGRVYVITFTVTDGHSAPVTSTVKVTVPHDQAHAAVDSGIRVDSGL